MKSHANNETLWNTQETQCKRMAGPSENRMEGGESESEWGGGVGWVGRGGGGGAKKILKNKKKSHMGFEGVLTRRKCAGKWCAAFWDPRAPDLVSLNSRIFNFHDFRHSWKLTSSQNASKLVLGAPSWSSNFLKS